MTHIVALAGSLRSGSYNLALARTCADLAPTGCRIDVATPRGIPVYDGDLEAESGLPEAVETLKERIVAADGVILATPEYNQGVPGVFKNTIDWLSRPPADIARVFRERPVALCGASAGRNGTRAAQYAWLATLRTLGVQLWNGGQLYLASAGDRIDATGRVSDADTRARIEKYVAGFAAFCESG